MEKRFTKIGTLECSVSDDCPIHADEIGLWQDAEHDVVFMVPKLQNRHSAAVQSMLIGYEAHDARADVVEKESGYRIDDISQDGEFFGEDIPITLQENNAVGGKFVIEMVTFADGRIWRMQTERVEESGSDPDEVTMVQTIGGFGPEGMIYRKVPLSAIISQRMTTQFVTTIIAIVFCVFTLANCIGFIRQNNETITDQLSEMLLESKLDDIETTEAAEKFITDNRLVDIARYTYFMTASILVGTLLFTVYIIFYLKETKKLLRSQVIKDAALNDIIKRLRVISIIELILYAACNFNIFGIFAGISGISVTVLHGRIMKNKKNKEMPQV